jgi:hypothetical protein
MLFLLVVPIVPLVALAFLLGAERLEQGLDRPVSLD